MRSDHVKAGIQQAPHRSLFNALGFTREEMQKPMVGIVSSYNEIVPGHMNLDKIVEAVKLGVAEAGGVPMACTLDGVLRGILPDGTPVHKGMKAGDVDPRCETAHCYCASDKALAVGGGVLEAILRLSGALRRPRP